MHERIPAETERCEASQPPQGVPLQEGDLVVGQNKLCQIHKMAEMPFMKTRQSSVTDLQEQDV